MGKNRKSSFLFAAMAILVIAIVITSCANAQNKKDVVDNQTTASVETIQLEESEPEYFVQGIDVSHWQGDIDFSKISKQMIVVRLGYSGYENWKCNLDKKFNQNMAMLENDAVGVALYWASHSVSMDEVLVENQFIIEELEKLSPQMKEKIKFIFIDREQVYDPNKANSDIGRADFISDDEFNEVLCGQVKLLQQELSEIKVGIYTNVEYLATRVDYQRLGDVPCWIAWYSDADTSSFEPVIERTAQKSMGASIYLKKNIVMWQYSKTGKIDGIAKDTKVDFDLVSSKMFN